MTARILDGNALSAKVREHLAQNAAALKATRGVVPCLAVILVGEDPASQVYVRNKVAACEKAGFRSIKQTYPPNVEPVEVLAKIAELNADPAVHGILVQLPLPKQFDAEAVLEAISPEKDVDGFHAENVGALMQGAPRFVPCTPYGVMKMLESENVPLKGAEAVIVGRSNIVGINRLPDGKLCGDVDFESAKAVAGLITPVPGGVGPMTITMLLANTLESAERTVK